MLRKRRRGVVPLAKAEDLPTSERSPQRLVEDEERRQELFTALTTLPTDQREMVRLFYWLEYSQREIASQFGIPVTTVNNRLRLAHTKLREELLAMADLTNEKLARSSSGNSELTSQVIAVHRPIIDVQFKGGRIPPLRSALVPATTSPAGEPRLTTARNPGAHGLALPSWMRFRDKPWREIYNGSQGTARGSPTLPRREENRPMRREAPAIIGLLVSLSLVGCQVFGNKPPNPDKTVKVERGSVVETVNPTGVVVAGTTANLNFAFSGTLASYDVALGQTVTRGQVLAELDPTSQEAAGAQAQANLAIAEDKLAGISQLPPGTQMQAQGNLDAAKAKLQVIQQGPRTSNVAEARAALDAAEQKLAQMQAGPRRAAVTQAKANVAAAQAAVDTAQVNLESAQNNTSLLVASAEAKLQSAKDARYAAQASRDGICGGRSSSFQCQAANASVNSAQDDVNAAAYALTQQQAAGQASVKTAASALAQAKAQLLAVQSALALVAQPYTQQDLAQQADAVAEAKAALDLAERPYTASDLAQAQAGVTSATGALENAQKPYTPSDLAQAQDTVKGAQAALQAAQFNLDHTKLVAPFAGTILSEPLAPGDFVGTNANPIVLGTTGAGSGGLEVNASVDEVDIAKIKTGQSVTISAVAVPGKVFHGQVTVVPPQGVTVLNVVTYPTYIALADGQDVLKPGMTVSCTIDVAKHTNTLVVPTAAVSDINGKTYVMLPSGNGGKPVPQVVTTGIASLTRTEILSGLKAGQEVLLGASPKRVTTGPGG